MSRRPSAIPHRFLLLLLFFLLWCASSGGQQRTASAQCLPDQSAALLRLKQGFNHSTLGALLPSWRPGTDCCRGWAGVTCDVASGRVLALDLSNSTISGDVNPALFQLTSLRSLNLSCNQFDPVPMPSEGFGMLANLTHLNLSDSGFDGQIPVGISRLKGLVSLDLSVHNICSSSSLRLQSPDLKTLVRGLANLTVLYLDGVNISADGHQWGQALSSYVPNLRELSLSGCSLSGPIDPSLYRLTSLTLLRLHQNNLSSEVPGFLGDFSSLTLLRLSSCGLRGSLPSTIFSLPLLRTLDLSKNPTLSGSLLPGFPANSTLEQLLLFDTSFSGNLPDSLGNLRFLKILRLSGCNFSGRLPASFRHLARLVYADLSSNNFTGPIPSFANISKLDLQNNSLTGSVRPWLFHHPSLQTLRLSSNQLHGGLGEFRPVNSVLEIVDLRNNKLQGPIPESVSNLRGVKELRLSSNRFNGTVGLHMFGDLGNLSILDLSNNMLTVETTPSSPASFPNVSTLNLASCNVAEFPDLLRNQARLSRLDLSNNRIHGAVPTWLWSVGNGALAYLNLSHNSLTGFESSPDLSASTLSVLDLHSNKLRGAIPRPPPSNIVVDYSDNSFTSVLPPDIGSSLNFTIFFSVSNNSVRGEIPESICSSSYLQVLDLSLNCLRGEIPRCLADGENDLRVLNLRGNRLSGSLPNTFEEGYCKLRTLNVNGNRVGGTVPQNLSRCGMLEVLDLGNNQIEGTFPFWLGELPGLRVLVLRSNRFHGPLQRLGRPPCSNCTFSMVQIMDLSSNQFNGTLPTATLRSWRAMTATGRGQDAFQVGSVGFLNLTRLYYQDTVTVRVKGMEMTLVKLLTIFTSIDLSNNSFVGSIPEEVGELSSLRVLNMSRNGLTGRIPSNIASLKVLESLDLSCNNLSGEIPPSLASLTFLSVLNLSNNQLVGQIPQGGQISTFTDASFLGNQGLCGIPLKRTCPNKAVARPATPASNSMRELNWDFIFVGLGYGGGLALVMGPFVFWSNGRRWYNQHVDRMLWAVVPSGLWLCGECRDGKVDAEERVGGGSDTEEEEEEEQVVEERRYCVFCTQLEVRGQSLTVRHVHCSCNLEQ